MRFLIGSLYNNFKLLWEPLCDLIASHANGLERAQFWEIYKDELVLASERTGRVCSLNEQPGLLSGTNMEFSTCLGLHQYGGLVYIYCVDDTRKS